jgi:23S rRNA maturation mini-RNase III
VKIKLNGRHFDTTEVVEAESQAVLNSLTDHYFQDAFKKWLKRWELRALAERGLGEGFLI